MLVTTNTNLHDHMSHQKRLEFMVYAAKLGHALLPQPMFV